MSVLISSLTKAAATEIGGRDLPISFDALGTSTPTATTPWEGRRSPRGSRPVADLVYRPRAVAAHRRRHVGHSVERTRMIERIVSRAGLTAVIGPNIVGQRAGGRRLGVAAAMPAACPSA